MDKLKIIIFKIYYVTGILSDFIYKKYEIDEIIKDKYICDIEYIKYIEKRFNLFIDHIKMYYFKHFYDLNKVRYELNFYDENNSLHYIIYKCLTSYAKDNNYNFEYDKSKLIILYIYENDVITPFTSCFYLGNIPNNIFEDYIRFFERYFSKSALNDTKFNNCFFYNMIKNNNKKLINNKSHM